MNASKSKYSLKTVNVAYTHKCNLCCYHCYINDKKKNQPDADIESWKDWLEQAKQMGVGYVSFGGGESFVRNDFYALLEYISGLGMSVGVITNGTYWKKISELRSGLIHTLSVSLDFADPLSHDRSRGHTGCYSDVLKTIEVGKQLGARIEVLTTVTNRNSDIDNLNKLMETIKDAGVSNWKLNRYKVLGRGAGSDLDVSPEQLELYHNFIIQYRQPSDIVEPILAGIYGTGLRTISCPCSETTIHIGNDGRLYPCLYVSKSIGSLRNGDLQSYWEDSPIINAFRSLKNTIPDSCAQCPGAEICRGGCIANSFTLGNVSGKSRDPYCYRGKGSDVSQSKPVDLSMIVEPKSDMKAVVGSNYITL